MSTRIRNSIFNLSEGTSLVIQNWTPSNEYATVLAAKATLPSLADQKNEDTWLKAMVAGGYYAKAELLDMFCLDTEANSLFNWKDPSKFNPELVGTFDPVVIQDERFRSYQGFRGDNSSGATVRLNFVPGSDGTLISQNNICFIVGIGSDYIRSGNPDFGAVSNVGGTRRLEIRSGFQGNLALYRANDSALSTVTNLNAIKHYAISRNAAGNYDSYINKVKQNFVVNSVGAVESELYACGDNDGGVIQANNRIVRYVFIFSYLTEAEINDVVDITDAYLANYHTNIINYDSYIVKPYKATKAIVPLTTYDGSGETVHPSVVSIPTGWNGYKYWMANTPFPGSVSTYEDPSIWQSNDGSTWTVPDGLTNPVIAKPVGFYNADTDLFYNSDDDKLYMIWKDSNGNKTKMCSSSDGVTWSVPVIVLTPSGTTIENTSPSLIKIGTKYYIYFNASNATLLNSVIKRVSCDTIDGTYVNEEIVNVPSANIGVAHIWWHLDISYLNGFYYLSAVSSTGTSAGTFIFVMKSSDGINFVKSPYPTVYYSEFSTESNAFYRPSLAIIEGQAVLYYSTHLSTDIWACVKMNVDLL